LRYLKGCHGLRHPGLMSGIMTSQPGLQGLFGRGTQIIGRHMTQGQLSGGLFDLRGLTGQLQRKVFEKALDMPKNFRCRSSRRLDGKYHPALARNASEAPENRIAELQLAAQPAEKGVLE